VKENKKCGKIGRNRGILYSAKWKYVELYKSIAFKQYFRNKSNPYSVQLQKIKEKLVRLDHNIPK